MPSRNLTSCITRKFFFTIKISLVATGLKGDPLLSTGKARMSDGYRPKEYGVHIIRELFYVNTKHHWRTICCIDYNNSNDSLINHSYSMVISKTDVRYQIFHVVNCIDIYWDGHRNWLSWSLFICNEIFTEAANPNCYRYGSLKLDFSIFTISVDIVFQKQLWCNFIWNLLKMYSKLLL